jgi:hypothetical protein
VLRRDRLFRDPPGVPADLPDHLRNPVVEVDEWLDRPNRRYQAMQQYWEYCRELSRYGENIQKALGISLDDFLAVSDRIGRTD